MALHGGRAAAARAVVLTAPEIHAHNTFGRPSDVAPAPETSVALGAAGARAYRFPPASVTRLTITLG